MKNKIVIGIDQSYKDTGITVSYNGKVMLSTNCYTEKLKSNSHKRKALQIKLLPIFEMVSNKANKYNAEVVVIIERIRLQSQGFLNINYIKSIGALNALIVDIAFGFDFPVFSVDTRAWKSAIIGTSKGMSNPYGIDEKKYPTIVWCIKHGYKKYIKQIYNGRGKKGVISKEGESYTYNDNIADSICISLYGYVNKPLLQGEH